MSRRFVSALALFVVFGPATAKAGFMVDLNPGGVKFFNDVANKNVDHFFGNVGGNGVGPLVRVDAVGNVDTGSGFSTITPVKDSSLTTLTFAPADGSLFDDFRFGVNC